MRRKPSGNIRVGLMRCDTHGMWFGPQMQDHDPVLFERAMGGRDDAKPKYSWMTRGCHFFFYTHYSNPKRMTAPRVDGFELVKLWDEDRDAAELAARVFHGKPKVCATFEEVSDDVDLVFIADCNGDGSDHLKLATPGLTKGVPTFIDKPFAHCYGDVKAIRDLARKHDTPVMSLSMLQTNPSTAQFARRLDEVGEVSFGNVTGYSTDPAALIHAISIVHHVFGTGIETVRCVKAPRHTAIHLDYGERKDRPAHGVVINCGVARFRFTDMFVCAYGPDGAIIGKAMDDFNVSEGSAVILEYVKEMVWTGKPHPLGDEMATAIAVMDAIRAAEEHAGFIRVSDIEQPGGRG